MEGWEKGPGEWFLAVVWEDHPVHHQAAQGGGQVAEEDRCEATIPRILLPSPSPPTPQYSSQPPHRAHSSFLIVHTCLPIQKLAGSFKSIEEDMVEAREFKKNGINSKINCSIQ